MRNKKFVFVPFCLLCPSFQAKSTVGFNEWNTLFIDIFQSEDINIIQLPCPESSFNGYNIGLSRKPHGVKYYESLDGFSEHCDYLSQQVKQIIVGMRKNNYSILAILGIEHSPTCAITYMYTNRGTQNRQGIFIEKLFKSLIINGIDIPFIGINRRHPQKALNKVKELINQR